MKILLIIILFIWIIHQQGVITIEHSIGPKFISKINTKQKLYYNNLGIRLDCLTSGNPLPTIVWFRKNNTNDRLLIPVQSSELIDLYKNGSLFIRPFQEYIKSIHGGSFICQATNPVGSIQSLPIQLKPQIYDAYEIEVKNPYGFVQSSVIITCEISPPIANSYLNIIGWLEKFENQIIELNLKIKTKYNILSNKNLIIHNLTKSDDNRSYACLIKNQIDNNTRQSRFKILRVRDRSPFGPELSIPNNTEYQIQLNDLIELPCGIASLSTNAKISWWKNGIELKNIKEKLYENSLILQISSSNDSGNYTCQINDELIGNMKSMLSLKVNLPITCELNIQQTNIHAGSNTELICTMNTIETLSIQWQWYHNSFPLSTKLNRYSIINATRKHMGMYQCCYIPSSSDMNGCCAQTQIRIINSPPFILPFNQTHLHNTIIYPKSISRIPIDLNCTIYGDPIPELNIYKDGQKLLFNNPIEYLPSGDIFLHYSILISNINDTGLYECFAKNSFGSISLSKHVNIENQKPFIQPLKNLTIRTNQEFILRCYASGQPNLYLQWIDDTTHQIINTSLTSPILLTLKNTKSHVYTCQAKNSYGEISSQIFLTIENPAKILSISSNQTSKIYERLEIYCFVEGDNQLELIFKTPSIEKRYENKKNISIIIDNIQMTDSGLYECYVKNNYSEDRASFEIIVQNKPDKIESIFLENFERIVWIKPFDGNSKINKYILRIQYKQDLLWSNETIITIDNNNNNEITNYSFENIFFKCMISIIIQAVNNIGSSLPSDTFYFQTNTKQLSIPPYNLTAVNISSTSVLLTWQYPSFYICNELNLKFAIEITDQNKQTIIQLHNHHSTMSNINRLRSYTHYTFVIYAINDYGSSPKSEPLKIQTIESVPLAIIVDLTSHLLNSSTTSLTWTFLENDYQFLNGKFRTFAVTIYENFNMSTLTTIETINTNLILHNLHSSSQYFISVSICNYFDCGPSSSSIFLPIKSFDTSTNILFHSINKPSSIRARIHYIMSNEIGLKIFYPPEIIENLVIIYKIQNTSLIRQLNISPPLLNIRLTNLSCGNLYEIMIYASNQIGLSSMEYLITKTEGSVPSLIESKDLFEIISNNYIIINMRKWLINICPILFYEIELFSIKNTSEILFNRYISSKNSFRIDNLQSNQDYQLNIKIHSEAGDNFKRISFRTIDNNNNNQIKTQQIIFIIICIALFLLTFILILIILKKAELFDDQKTRLKPVLYDNKNHRSSEKSRVKTENDLTIENYTRNDRSDSFASEDSQGNINPYAVTNYDHYQLDTIHIHPSILSSKQYFLSSSADSGVHSSYTHTPRCRTNQDNLLYSTNLQSNRHQQYSLV